MLYWCTMKHTKTIIALGIVVALLPFLGFPSSWKTVILAFLGLTIATLSFRLLSFSSRENASASTSVEDSNQQQNGSVQISEITVAHE